MQKKTSGDVLTFFFCYFYSSFAIPIRTLILIITFSLHLINMFFYVLLHTCTCTQDIKNATSPVHALHSSILVPLFLFLWLLNVGAKCSRKTFFLYDSCCSKSRTVEVKVCVVPILGCSVWMTKTWLWGMWNMDVCRGGPYEYGHWIG